MLSQIEKEIYIAGWFSEMKIVRLFLCPDILKFICKYPITGRSAVDYLIKVRGHTFMEAVQTIAGQAAIKVSGAVW